MAVKWAYMACLCFLLILLLHSCHSIDECTPNPCVLGVCVNLTGTFRCDCPPGTTGVICDSDIDECASTPCLNGGKCKNDVNSFNCICPSPYGGVLCQIRITPCQPNPCNNSGVCSEVNETLFTSTSYECACPQGYNGTNCEILWNHCLQPKCQNHGTCIPTSDSTASPPSHSYKCLCEPLFTGQDCETDYDPVDECASSPCVSGTCVNLKDMFRCDCDPGKTGTLCEIDVQCAALSVIKANETLAHGSGYMERKAYKCYPGYLFSDLTAEKMVFCQQDSTWNDTALAAGCRESCPFIPVVHNSNVDKKSAVVNITITFTCFVGQVINNNLTQVSFKCTADKVWEPSSTFLSCKPRICPLLPTHPHQRMDKREHIYDTTVTLWCDQGYKLFDNSTVRTIRCLADGTWSAALPPCLPKKCPEMALKARQMRDTSSVTYQTHAKYICDSGYRMLDGSFFKIIYCNAEQEWSDNITDCTPNRCFPLPYVANATPSTTDANFWTKSTLTCIPGHKFMRANGEFSKDVMVCQENGWWNPILTSCKPIFCPPINALGKNLTRDTDLRLYGTKVIYSCFKGFYTDTSQLINSYENQCLETQEWSKPYIQGCVPIECPVPPGPPLNGIRSTLGSLQHFYAEIVSYSCNDGKKFINGQRSKNIICNELGQWNDTDVSCKSERCDSVDILPNSTPDKRNTDWYVVVKYHCKQGYYRPDGLPYFAIKCLAGGIWNESYDHSKDCNIKSCSPVEHFSNSTVNNTLDTVYNTMLSYTCQPGFKYPDDEIVKYRRCNEDAIWVPTNFSSCLIIYCDKLANVENTTRDSNETHFSSQVTFDCLPGFQFPDRTKKQLVKCTENATWTHIPKPCEVVFCPPLPYWSQSIFNTTDNNFLSVAEYHCKEGSAFKSSHDLPGNLSVLTTTCQPSKQWQPPIETCYALDAINADIAGRAWESPQAYSLGTIACVVVGIVFAIIFFIDLRKILTDLQLMKKNINGVIKSRKKNRIRPSG